MKRLILASTAVVVLAAGLTACDARPSAETSAAPAAAGVPGPTNLPAGCESPNGGSLKIGLIVPNLQALFFNQIITGAQTVADDLGADLQTVSGNDDAVQQASAIDNLVASGVDALIVSPIDTEGVKPAIERAAQAGVKVVAVDGIVDSDSVSAQVGTSNAESGALMGEFLLKEATAGSEVGVVSALNSTIQLERQSGFIDAITAGGLTEGPVVDGKNVQETAQSAAENLLTGNPNLEYVYATGEPALIGLVAAVSSQSASDRISVVGWDLSESAVEGLNAGFVKGVVQQNTFEFGYQSMAAAIDLSCGETVERNISVPTQIVTPDNVSDYLYYLAK